MNHQFRSYPKPGEEPFNASPIEIAEAWEGRGIQAIETRWKGYKLRSRLEARWCVFFDTLDIEFQYEPEGFQLPGGWKYLPDFWLPQIRFWAEVKAEAPDENEYSKAAALAAGTGRPVLFLIGPPDFIPYTAIVPQIPFGFLEVPYSLDVERRRQRLYVQQGRLFSDPDIEAVSEIGCTPQYGGAIYRARAERFGSGKPTFDDSQSFKRGA